MFVHIIATLGCSPVVTDEDMDYPKNWLKMLHGDESSPSELVGHRPEGRTVCIHSIAVCPRLQGLGLGTATLKSYVQRLNSAGLADRVALICRQSETRFFQKCGFRNIGRSDTKTLPGEFYNMVCCSYTSMQSIVALCSFQALIIYAYPVLTRSCRFSTYPAAKISLIGLKSRRMPNSTELS